MGCKFWVRALVLLAAGAFVDGAQNNDAKQPDNVQLADSQLADQQPAEALLIQPTKKDQKYLKKEKKRTKKFLKTEHKGEKHESKADEKSMKKDSKDLEAAEQHEEKKEEQKKKKKQKYESKVDQQIAKEEKKEVKAEKKTAATMQQSARVTEQHKLVDQDEMQLSSAIVSLQKIRKNLKYLEHDPENIITLASHAQARAARALHNNKTKELSAFNKAKADLAKDWNEAESEEAANEYDMKLQKLKDQEDKDARVNLENERQEQKYLLSQALGQAEEAAKNMLKNRLNLHDAQLAAGESRKRVEKEARTNEYLAEHLRDKAEKEHDHALDAIHRIFAKAEAYLFEIQVESRQGVTPSPKAARNGTEEKRINDIRDHLLKATTTSTTTAPSNGPFLSTSDLIALSDTSRLPGCTTILCLLAAASLGLALVSTVHNQFSMHHQRTINAPSLLG